MGQKRKRLALSCVDCRRRKVKCDRTYPICVRCQKGGNADNCTYVSHTGLEPDLPTPSEDSPQRHHVAQAQIVPSGEPYVVAALREMSPHLEVQSRVIPPSKKLRQDLDPDTMHSLFGRAAQLETYTRSAGSKPVPAGLFADTDGVPVENPDGQQNIACDFSKVMVRGKNFSTHYYGPSFAISMLLQFEELSKFVKGLLNEAPSLAGLKEKMTKTRTAAKQAKRQSIYQNQTQMQCMVPERFVADQLVNLYLETFETTYRILHVPTFMKQYEAYWQDQSTAKPEFIALLLLVMATVYCVAPVGPEGFVGRSSACREVASNWVICCESWIEEQSHKHVTLAHFQARTLAFIARAMLCIKLKREWTASGQLLRFAMAVGMHREPSLLSKRIDVFDQEMRRRLWYTIVELDLLTTISRGMPPTIDSFSWDCLPPRNIDDEDFNEGSEQLPPSKSRSTFTRTSFLHIATESLPLRVEVLGRINSVRLSLDLDAVMQYDGKLRAIVDDVPSWKSSMSTTFAQSLSTLALYDFILVLHIPFASQTQNRAKSFFSTASKRDASYKTLRVYAQMPDIERLMFTSMRDDACRATLALSHDMTRSLTSDVVPQYDQALKCMEIVVNTLGTRFGMLGQGFHSYWITLSAFYLLRWKVSSQPSEAFAQEAAKCVSDIFHQMLQRQIPMPHPNGDLSNAELPNPSSVPSLTDSMASFETSFPNIDQMNFFDDPFSDMNFDLSTMWNVDGWLQ